jgi:hypothetical protein
MIYLDSSNDALFDFGECAPSTIVSREPCIDLDPTFATKSVATLVARRNTCGERDIRSQFRGIDVGIAKIVEALISEKRNRMVQQVMPLLKKLAVSQFAASRGGDRR